MVLLRVLPRRVEQSVPPANGRARVSRPVHADTGRRLDRGRIALVRIRPVHAGENHTAPERRARVAVPAYRRIERLELRAGRARIEPDGDVVVRFAQTALVFETQSIVERQARAHAPVVLHVAAAVVQVVHAVAAVEIDRAGARGAEEEAGEVVSADTTRSRRELILKRVGAGGRVEQRRRDLHPPEVAAEFPRVTADQLRQRRVDRHRALPRDRRRIQVLSERHEVLERDRGKQILRRRIDFVEIRLAEAEGAQAVGEAPCAWRAAPAIAPVGEDAEAVAEAQDRRIAEHVRAVDDEHLGVANQPVGALVEKREVVGHRRRRRLLSVVIDEQTAQRRFRAELVFDLDREHVGDVRQVDGQVLVRKTVLVALKRARKIAGHLERDRACRGMRPRNDAADEQPASLERPRARGGTLRVRDAGATVRVVDLKRSPAERGGRKIAVALPVRRPRLTQALRHGIAIAFAGEPEERPAFFDRPADAAAVKVVVGRRQPAAVLRRAALVGEVLERFTPDGAVLKERRAVERVRARSGRRIEHAAAGSAHLGVVGVHLHLDVVDRLDRRVEDGEPADVGDRHAVERVVVRLHAAAPERDLRRHHLILLPVEPRLADGEHRRHFDANHVGVASRRGERLEHVAVEHAADRGVRRLDQRGIRGHRDALLDGADLEEQIDRDELLRRDPDPVPLEGLVALQRRANAVGRGRERREVVLADRVGHRLARNVRVLVGHDHGGRGNHAVVVAHAAPDPAGELLAERVGARGQNAAGCQEEWNR